ncbi:MAG: Thioredoxin reductase [Myxococcota bacterium]|nr:Thioredoxin reductase [Myxococcota bacterium]
MAENNKVENVVILGSGPAGLTAALYSARANLNPVVLEGMQPGGQLTITTEVENYPGFREGVMGPQLMEDMRAQVERFGTRFVFGDCSEVHLRENPIRLVTDNGEIRTKTLIIATGATAKLLGLPSEKQFMGHGVSACATCDGAFFRNVPVVVVGGGDTALEEANFLTRFASKVYLVHRRDELRASKIMQDRAKRNPKIEFIWNTVLEEVIGEGKKVTHARLRNIRNNETLDLPCEGIFIAIGHQPNTELFKGQLPMDETGYLHRHPNTSHTDIPGVFVAGDVADSRYRQAVTAAGMGCMAAMDAEKYLEELEG